MPDQAARLRRLMLDATDAGDCADYRAEPHERRHEHGTVPFAATGVTADASYTAIDDQAAALKSARGRASSGVAVRQDNRPKSTNPEK